MPLLLHTGTIPAAPRAVPACGQRAWAGLGAVSILRARDVLPQERWISGDGCPCSSETGNTSVPQLPQHSCTMAFVLLALLGIRIQDDLFGLPKYYAPKLEEAWKAPVVK